jgi:hypothetical protein
MVGLCPQTGVAPAICGYSRYAAQQMLSAEIEIVFVIVAGILL